MFYTPGSSINYYLFFNVMATVNYEDYASENEKDEKDVIKTEDGKTLIREKVEIETVPFKRCISSTLGFFIDFIPIISEEGEMTTEVWIYTDTSNFKLFCEIMEENPDKDMTSDEASYISYLFNTYIDAFTMKMKLIESVENTIQSIENSDEKTE